MNKVSLIKAVTVGLLATASVLATQSAKAFTLTTDGTDFTEIETVGAGGAGVSARAGRDDRSLRRTRAHRADPPVCRRAAVGRDHPRALPFRLSHRNLHQRNLT